MESELNACYSLGIFTESRKQDDSDKESVGEIRIKSLAEIRKEKQKQKGLCEPHGIFMETGPVFLTGLF